MTPVTPLPSAGEVFLDERGDGRAMRVSWHPEADLVVLSLWRGGTCAGTFRLPVEEVPDLIGALQGMRVERDGPAGRGTAYDARVGRSAG